MPEALALWAIATTVGVLAVWLRRARCPASWQAAAAACDLTDLRVRAPFIGSAVMEGLSGNLHVRFESYSDGTRFSIEGLPLGHNLSLRRGGPGEFKLGDANFDKEVQVAGHPTLARAILDAETRRRVRQLLLVGDRVAVSDGRVQMDVPRPYVPNPESPGRYTEADHDALEALGATLKRLLEFTQRLLRHDVVQRLAHNVRSDPEVEVRRNNLVTVIREYPDRPEARETFRAALGDSHPALQLEAAVALGDEGTEFLLGIAAGNWGDSSTARALTALGRRLPRERVQPILEQALRTRRLETARACLAVLGLHGDAEAIEALAKILLVERSELAAEAARALAATGHAAAQEALCEALNRNVPELRVAAAEALGRVGTSEAVLALREAEARYDEDGDLRRATRQAIAEIQSRLTGASPGQLSLAEGESGRLSLSEGAAGQLSLAAGRRVGSEP